MYSFCVCFALCVILIVQVRGGLLVYPEGNIRISPEHAHIAVGESLSVICKTDVPIASCFFRIRCGDQDSTVFDAMKNPNMRAALKPTFNNTGIFTLKSVPNLRRIAEDLEAEQCGVTLSNLSQGEYLVGCSVTDAKGVQQEEFMSLLVHRLPPIKEVNIEPRNALVLPGKHFSVLCHSPRRLTGCSFVAPSGEVVNFERGVMSVVKGKYRYYGMGLKHGDCGITVFNADVDDNGVFWCHCRSVSSAVESRAAVVVVVDEPTKPEIIFPGIVGNYTSDFTLFVPRLVWQDISVQCEVKRARPAPALYWTSESKRIDSDNSYGALQREWYWPWEPRDVVISMKKLATWRDHMKDIECVAKQPGTGVISKSPTIYPVISCSRNSRSISLIPRVNTIPLVVPVNSSDPVRFDSNELSTSTTETEIHTSITPGNSTEITDNPWQVSIFVKDKKAAEFYINECGGTILKDRYIVTAAHCVWDVENNRALDTSLIFVVAGKLISRWSVREVGDQRVGVKQIFVHPRYRHWNTQSDIAVLQLNESIRYTHNIQPACVDWENVFEVGPKGIGTIAGWGLSGFIWRELGLLSADLPYFDFYQCFDSIENSVRGFSTTEQESILNVLTRDKFCAGYTHKNITVCRGDSGGGIFFREAKTEEKFLRGIKSVIFRPFNYDQDLCYEQQVTGFTDFKYYAEWVHSIIQ